MVVAVGIDETVGRDSDELSRRPFYSRLGSSRSAPWLQTPEQATACEVTTILLRTSTIPGGGYSTYVYRTPVDSLLVTMMTNGWTNYIGMECKNRPYQVGEKARPALHSNLSNAN